MERLTRPSHPATSAKAAQQIVESDSISRDRLAALEAIKKAPGMTGYELDKLNGHVDGILRKRLPELRSLGLAVNGQNKICTVRGNECQTWWAADHPMVASGEVKKKAKDFDDISVRFEKFWNEYPRRISKKGARQAFVKINPDDALLGVMIESLRRYKGNTRDKGGWKDPKTHKLISQEFIPHAQTWLNAERWNDELPPVVQETVKTLQEKIKQQQDRFRTEISNEEREKANAIWKAHRERMKHGNQDERERRPQVEVGSDDQKDTQRQAGAQDLEEAGPGAGVPPDAQAAGGSIQQPEFEEPLGSPAPAEE